MSEEIKINNINYIPNNANYIGQNNYSYTTLNTVSLSGIDLLDILKDPVSYSISHGSYNMISNPKYNSDIFIDIIDESEYPPSIITSISYDNIYWKFDSGILSSEYKNDDIIPEYVFYIDIKNSDILNISHTNESGTWFLKYDSALSSMIFTDIEEEATDILYSYDTQNKTIIFLLSGYGSIGYNSYNIDIKPISSELTIFNLDERNTLDLSKPIHNSVVPLYSNKSTFNTSYEVDNMFLFVHNFESSNTSDSNLITLKNNLIYDETHSLITIAKDMKFRDYSSINTGIRCNEGFSNYLLNYNTNQYKISFTPDIQTFFNIPYDLDGYEQININDCSLIENGSFGGNSPLNSDKIYKKLYEYSDVTNTGITPSIDNGKYLCTWLWYNPVDPSKSVWLDRYYKPDIATKLDALSNEAWLFTQTLSSVLDNAEVLSDQYEEYLNEFRRDEIGIFDIISKLTFEPNSLYMYERIGSNASAQLISQKDEYITTQVSNQLMDYENYKIIKSNKTGEVGNFTISIVLEDFVIDNVDGEYIFTNSNASLKIDDKYTPYKYFINENIIEYYDFDYNKIDSIEFTSDIVKIIPTNDYNRFFVLLSDNNLITVENLTFVSNIIEISGVVDVVYDSGYIYSLNESGSIKKIDVTENSIIPIKTIDSKYTKILVKGDSIEGYIGDKLDYNQDLQAYTLSSNAIYFNDISTPAISSEIINDMYVNNDIMFIISDSTLYKLDVTSLPKISSSIIISDNDNYLIKNIIPYRYLRDGVIYEGFDLLQYNLSSDLYDIAYRYNNDMELIGEYNLSSYNLSSSYDLSSLNELFVTKYNTKSFTWKFTLINLFRANNNVDIFLEIPANIIEESKTCILNAVINNDYGNVTIYCNGEVINIYKFDINKYYFSDILQNKNIFIGVSNYNNNYTINEQVESSINDMISGNYTISDFILHNYAFNYYDVISFNRKYNIVNENYLILPIHQRSYTDEIAGFFIQNKHLHKSLYGNINIDGTVLTDVMKEDVSNHMQSIIDNTFINLEINNIDIN